MRNLSRNSWHWLLVQTVVGDVRILEIEVEVRNVLSLFFSFPLVVLVTRVSLRLKSGLLFDALSTSWVLALTSHLVPSVTPILTGSSLGTQRLVHR